MEKKLKERYVSSGTGQAVYIYLYRTDSVMHTRIDMKYTKH